MGLVIMGLVVWDIGMRPVMGYWYGTSGMGYWYGTSGMGYWYGTSSMHP